MTIFFLNGFDSLITLSFIIYRIKCKFLIHFYLDRGTLQPMMLFIKPSLRSVKLETKTKIDEKCKKKLNKKVN